MFIEIFVKWLQACLVGIGCSLLATGLLAIVIPTAPIGISVSLVLGMLFLMADLIISLCLVIPKSKEEEA